MAHSITRANEPIARYLAAIMLAVVTWLGLRAMPFYPPWLELALALGVGVLAAFSAATASLAFVIVLALPVIRADLVAGIAFLLLGLVATQYLSVGRAGGFLLAVLGVAAVPLHAEWAVIALAGYLLGRGKGALTAVTVLLSVAAVGIALPRARGEDQLHIGRRHASGRSQPHVAAGCGARHRYVFRIGAGLAKIPRKGALRHASQVADGDADVLDFVGRQNQADRLLTVAIEYGR